MPLSKRFVVSSALAFAAIATPARAQQTPPAPADTRQLHRLRLDECVVAALERNLDVQTANGDVTMSEADRANVRGRFGPKVKLDAFATQYDQAYSISGFKVHDAFTWNVTPSITQPLSGLFAIYDAYKVAEIGVDIASIKREATRRQTALRVVEGYYRLLQTERLVDVAIASVEQLDSQLKQAKSFHDNGVVSQDDVLRAQLAVANAQQRLIVLRSQVNVERSRLALDIGMPADAAIDGIPLAVDQPPPRDSLTMPQAEKTAELQRVELREVDRRIDQAEASVSLAKRKLGPDISATAAFVHNEGSLFSPTNSGYVGANATWDIWDWGTTISGITHAKAQHQQVIIARSKLSDQIRLEVRRAFSDVDAASEAMAVAQASVASAEENFRLVKKRYDANAATSFAVVDAEGLLTQARGQMQTALYDFVIARAELRTAIGTSPDALTRP